MSDTEFKVGDKLFEDVFENMTIQEFKEHTNKAGNKYKSIYTIDNKTQKKYLLILISVGYGSGWSTEYDNEIQHQLLTDSRLIYDVYNKKIKMNKNEIDTDYYNNKLFGNYFCEYFYYFGLESCEIQFVEKGEQFKITNYDGYENIEIYNSNIWFIA